MRQLKLQVPIFRSTEYDPPHRHHDGTVLTMSIARLLQPLSPRQIYGSSLSLTLKSQRPCLQAMVEPGNFGRLRFPDDGHSIDRQEAHSFNPSLCKVCPHPYCLWTATSSVTYTANTRQYTAPENGICKNLAQCDVGDRDRIFSDCGSWKPMESTVAGGAASPPYDVDVLMTTYRNTRDSIGTF